MSSLNPLAFSVTVLTPLRSASGWTRGMPPPPSHSLSAPHRLVARPLVPRPLSLSRGPCAALSEPAVQPLPDPAPNNPTPADPDETVNAYVLDPALPSDPLSSPTIDQLVSRLEHDEPPHSPHRPRRSVLSSSRDQTLSVHAGERVRGGRKTKAMLDAIQTPIVQSATFTFRSTQDCIDYNRGMYDSFEYGRYGNPTTRAVEEKIMALDHAEDCLLSASGMNAVTTMLLALVPQGGHVVTTTDCYRRTRQFVNTMLPKMGIGCTVLDPADMDGLKATFEKHEASVYFSESPTNPMIRVVDVPRIVELCRQYNVISVFDTTFATPVNFRPMDFGADLVLHSGTKYLAGHQDVMSGALTGRGDLIDKVRKLHGVLGGVVDPHAAYLINRGMKTLGLRVEAHNKNAETVARYLKSHPKVARVNYPTVDTHPDFAVANSLFDKGFGGVLSFELVGDGNAWSGETFRAGGRFVDGLRIAYIGPSLGGCETIVEQVCIMGYFDQPLRERQRLGINNGLIRLACGIEDTNDLVDDIEAALSGV